MKNPKIYIFLISLFLASCVSLFPSKPSSGSRLPERSTGSRLSSRTNKADTKNTTTENTTAENANTETKSTDSKGKANLSSPQATQYSQTFGYPVNRQANPALLAMVKDWLGTPYQYAGSSKSGADCSGFVQQVYLKIYEKPTSRTADGMEAQSKSISKSGLKEGDMVFFKINTPDVGHVGVYLQDGYFAHASTAKGVVISNLSETYYEKYFVGGGRL